MAYFGGAIFPVAVAADLGPQAGLLVVTAIVAGLDWVFSQSVLELFDV